MNGKLITLLILYMGTVHANSLPQWHIDPSKSSLEFSATQNNAPVTGSFKNFTGTVYYDPAQLNNSSIAVEVTMNSISTSYSQLTNTLLGADWFDTAKYSQAKFQSTHMQKVNGTTYTAPGTLTIRNQSAPITITFTLTPLTQDSISADGYADIKRSVFGVGQGSWASTNEIKDEVHVHFKITAEKMLVNKSNPVSTELK